MSFVMSLATFNKQQEQQNRQLPVLETKCNCQTCVSMCKHFPCKGSLQELKIIIEAGYAKSLMLYTPYIDELDAWIEMLMPAVKGYEAQSSEPIDFSNWVGGKCTLLTEDNLCAVHHIKPIGRIADCQDGKSNGLTKQMYNDAYSKHKRAWCATWQTDEARELIQFWKQEVDYDSDCR